MPAHHHTVSPTTEILSRFDAEIMGAIDRALQEDMGLDNPRAYDDARQHIGRLQEAFAALAQIRDARLIDCSCHGSCGGTCTHAAIERALAR